MYWINIIDIYGIEQHNAIPYIFLDLHATCREIGPRTELSSKIVITKIATAVFEIKLHSDLYNIQISGANHWDCDIEIPVRNLVNSATLH